MPHSLRTRHNKPQQSQNKGTSRFSWAAQTAPQTLCQPQSRLSSSLGPLSQQIPGSPKGLGGVGAVLHSLYCSGALALSEDREKRAAGHMELITHSFLCLQSIVRAWQHNPGGSRRRRRSWSCRALQDISITQSQLGNVSTKPKMSSPCPLQCLKFVKWTENAFCVRTLRQVKHFEEKTEPGIQQESAKEISSTAETESSFP